MDESALKHFAAQLRKPEGEAGKQTGERMNTGNKHINEWTIEMLQLKPGDKVLEIGMGNGFFVNNILSEDESIKYTGCDFSEIMIEESVRINQKLVDSGRAEFFLANAEALPLEDQRFTKAFTINTIYFWENPEKVLSEIRRVLKPEGILIISLRPKEHMEKYPFTRYGFRLYSEEEVVELLMDNGFTPVMATEREEGEWEIAGEKVKVASLMVAAEKNP